MSDDFKTTGYHSKTFNGAGRPHAFTKRGREFAQRLVESESYRKWIQDRINAKTLDPSIERMLWAYAYGKPKEYVEINVRKHELGQESADVLQARVKTLADLLSQLNAAQTRAEADRLMAVLESEAHSDPVH